MSALPAPDLAQARAYLEALTGSADTPVSWQLFDDAKLEGKARPELARILHGPLDGVAETLTRANALGAGVFITVNETNLKGRKASNITAIRALFTDEDGPRLRDYPLAPSFRVLSGGAGRAHAYFRVNGDAPRASFTPFQKQLIAYYGSDPDVHDLPRVMRVPGFFHMKKTPTLVRFEAGSGRVYTLAEILAAHQVPRAPKTSAEVTTEKRPSTTTGRTSKIEKIVREKADARDWTENHRHASAKATTVHGRKLGLPDEVLRPLVAGYLLAAGKEQGEADRLVTWALEDVAPDPKETSELRRTGSVLPPDDRPLDDDEAASLEAHYAGADGNATEPPGRDSAAAVLVEIGVRSSHLFHDDRETPFAAIGPSGARRIVPIKGSVYSQFLAGSYYRERAKAANGEALAAAKNVLGYKALFEGERHSLHNRFALHDGALWIDLADERQRAVRVTPDGWTVTTPPILFRRFAAQAPLPEPKVNGDLKRLIEFLNVRSREDELLVLAWLVVVVIGNIPRPALMLHGPQGSAKTTAAKMLRKLTDPSAAASNRLSAHDDELALTLESNALPLFDNVVSIPPRAAELLCQAVTGGGFSKRELFTDSGEVVYSYLRAILLTGINIPTSAPDLLDRLLLVQLERVNREDRRPDAAVWRAFDAAAPGLFGGLLDALAGAMRVHAETEAEVSCLERMADFTLWGASVAEAIGYGRGAFLAAYQANVSRQTEEVLEADPVARAVRELVTDRGAWSGTASDLFKVFRDRHGEEVKAKDSAWPKRAESLGRRLRILQSTLAEVGISMRWDRQAGGNRVRTVTLEPTGPAKSRTQVSQPSQPSLDDDWRDGRDGRDGCLRDFTTSA